MTIERKAFKAIYNLIQSGSITEKQAYDLCVAVFFVPPTFNIQADESPAQSEEQNKPTQTVVKGFVGEGPESGRRATNSTRKV